MENSYLSPAPPVRARNQPATVGSIGSENRGKGLISKSFLWSFGGGLVSRFAVLVNAVIVLRSVDPLTFGRYAGLSATALLAAGFWDVGFPIS